MKHIYQQPTKKTCGQTCLAMLLDLSVDQVKVLVDKEDCTQTKDLARALRARGWTCPDKLRPVKGVPPFVSWPKYAILKLSYPGHRYWHWVLWAEGRTWNPSDERHTMPLNLPGRVTSILPLTPPNKRTN